MTVRALLKIFVPPIIPLIWRRIRPVPAPAPQPQHVAAEHTVTAGPLKGNRLFVASGMPSYRDMLSGVYDKYLFDAMPRQDLHGKMLLDIGAHIGYHALSFAALQPDARVVAFEPNPVNVKRARANFALSPLLAARIELMELALSAANGTVMMNGSSNVEDQTSSGSYIAGASKPLDDAIYRRSNFKPFEVECRSLDDLVTEQHWKDVAVMKIDVEGAEHLVLQGARRILERDRPLLLIEVHSVVCMMEVLRVIVPLGYRTELLHEDRASRCFIAAM